MILFINDSLWLWLQVWFSMKVSHMKVKYENSNETSSESEGEDKEGKLGTITFINTLIFSVSKPFESQLIIGNLCVIIIDKISF